MGRTGSVDNLSTQRAALNDQTLKLKDLTVIVAGSAFKRGPCKGPLKRDRCALGYEANRTKLALSACYVVEATELGSGRLVKLYSAVFNMTAHNQPNLASLPLQTTPPTFQDFQRILPPLSSKLNDSQRADIEHGMQQDCVIAANLVSSFHADRLSLRALEDQAWTTAVARSKAGETAVTMAAASKAALSVPAAAAAETIAAGIPAAAKSAKRSAAQRGQL